MKLFVVTCLKDFQELVIQIFKDSQIPIFSLLDVKGIKNGKEELIQEEWFSNHEEKLDSIVLFSFTTEENAQKGIKSIIHHNSQINQNFPLRGFILPVETSTY